MEYDPKDNEVVHLLKKLKESNGTYPPEMLALRRQGYIKQVAQVSAGAGLAMGLKNIARGGKGVAGMPPVAGTIIEALLVIAIVSEAAAVTYFYRDKLVQYYRSITNAPRVEQVASPPVLPSPIAEIATSPSPVVTMSATASGTVTASQTGTVSPTAEGTPSLELAADATQQGSGNGTTTAAGSTGGPNTGSEAVPTRDPKSNNGNQYGLTPKPVRTKQPGNDVSNSSTQESSSSPTKKKKP